MKIGLLTFHWPRHIGAFLQAYALYHSIRLLSRDVTIINYVPRLKLIVSPTIKINELISKYRILKGGYLQKTRSIIGETTNYLIKFSNMKRTEKSYDNLQKLFKLTEPIYNLASLRRILEMFDVVVTGSDQIWNPDFLKYSDYAYILPFKLQRARKVAFSASIGVDSFPSQFIELLKRSLQDFSFVSLRERIHAEALTSLIGRRVYHTLDPTLLLNRPWYEALADQSNINVRADEFIFVYNLDTEVLASMLSAIESLAKSWNLNIIAYRSFNLFPIVGGLKLLLNLKDYVRSIKFAGFIDPFEFLELIRKSRIVVTNSYHGAIFQ